MICCAGLVAIDTYRHFPSHDDEELVASSALLHQDGALGVSASDQCCCQNKMLLLRQALEELNQGSPIRIPESKIETRPASKKA